LVSRASTLEGRFFLDRIESCLKPQFEIGKRASIRIVGTGNIPKIHG
jgi:hypothetical protein